MTYVHTSRTTCCSNYYFLASPIVRDGECTLSSAFSSLSHLRFANQWRNKGSLYFFPAAHSGRRIAFSASGNDVTDYIDSHRMTIRVRTSGWSVEIQRDRARSPGLIYFHPRRFCIDPIISIGFVRFHFDVAGVLTIRYDAEWKQRSSDETYKNKLVSNASSVAK